MFKDDQSSAASANATDKAGARPTPQAVVTPLTPAAIFMVATVNDDAAAAKLRSFCGDLSGLVRAVAFRDLEGALSCVVGFGARGWDRAFGAPRPAELHPFREFLAEGRHAMATPGDIMFHIRARRMDLCFELATVIMDRIGALVSPVDEVQGFRYFDDRDLIGFVDGTENPADAAAVEAAIVGDEDQPFSGGSYVVVQKYLHDMKAWNAVPTERQELIIGRRKLSDIELDDVTKPDWAHSALTVIEKGGREIKILRANMPFGSPSQGEFGTYFIGYSRSPATIEQMLENMFVGRPPGNYDRLLDFSRPVTGGLFFAPAASFLNAAADIDATSSVSQQLTPPARDRSLAIGSLKGDLPHE